MTPRELMTDYLDAARRSRFVGDRRGKQAAMGYIQSIREHYTVDALTGEI